MNTITEDDFLNAAKQLDAPLNYVKAVCEVESPRGGFDSHGKPFILFEAHKFAKLTGGKYNTSNPKVSSPVWNRKLYATGGSADIRNAGEHERLAEAVYLNRAAALMSTSWGRFQILGENFGGCGFDTLEEFVTAMSTSEPQQLLAFIEYISDDKRKHPITGKTMLQALRVGDWASFARLYNGSAYAENQYDKKLTVAAAKYAPKAA